MSMPLFIFGYPSAVNHDLQNGNVMNTHWNFMNADFMARSIMNFVPYMSFNCFNYPDMAVPFCLPSVFSTGFQLDFNPPQTNNQWSWGNWIQNPLNSWMQGINKNNTANNNSTVTTEEDQKKKDNINKLLDTLKNIMANSTLRGSVESKVKYAIEHYSDNNASLDAQYNTLKNAYKAIPSSVLEKYIMKSLIDDEAVTDLLKRAGYENTKTRSNGLTSSQLKEFKDGINDITDSSNDNESVDLTANAKNGSIDVLDLISAWNSAYPNDNLIDLLGNKYNENIGINKDAVYRRLSDLVSALTDEADRVVDTEINDELVLDEETIENIKTLKQTLLSALERKNETVNTDAIKDAFNKLYTTLRMAEATIVQEKINRKYEFLGDDYGFAKDFIIESTKTDLKNEGLQKVAGTVTLRDVEQNEDLDENNDELTPEQKIAQTKAALSKMNDYVTRQEDGTYLEKRPEGDDTEPRTFTINDEGKLVDAKGNETTPEEIKKDIKTAQAKLDKAAEAEKNNANAERSAQYMIDKLETKNSKTRHYSEIEDRISKVNKDNVKSFLDEFYAVTEGKEDIIKYLDKNLNNSEKSMKIKKDLIKSVLEKAKKAGLEDTEEYQTIKEILDIYESDDYKDKTNFKNKYETNTRSTGKAIGAIAGGAAVGAGAAGVTAATAAVSTSLAAEGVMAATIAGLTGGSVAATAGATGAAAFIASNPVGWIVGGTLLVGAAGYGVYRLCTNGTKDQQVLDECIKSLCKQLNQ